MAKRFHYLLLSAVLGFAAVAQAADEVKLLRARSVISSKYGFVHQNATFDVKVRNLGYDKQVVLHYREPDGAWQQTKLRYSHPTGPDSEVWLGHVARLDQRNGQPMSPASLEFSISYQVNGVEFRDDNHSRNYRIDSNEGELLFDRVVYNSGYGPVLTNFYGNTLYGNVVLKNIAPEKSVQVVYSVDNWQTVKLANANYSPYFWTGWYSWLPNPSPAGFEVWNYELDIGDANRVDYAIRYGVAGQEYWDNNGGRNYRVEIMR
ncbi:hypothetical protein [Chitinimonas lacunae]|uniref:CBM21 domain-containing protein n=1 Tax=Chitinimonas lacunae TaxID=1963018 RepID=A0ABV8MV69_9NEIS